ncbi:hypothetical protein HELRODRAFT_157859 [Helobdella robusta]|uniref:mitogen-activated protein kinase n=1 Tax=Helobdella robusta TaxID=6412 RepID=T1EMH0_HELRO|nr:hypothetical protein HELRODRAFT_157859 [Helobdella robusta]ESN93518.1 hypothetical protein HELRODRAFT_157859 [Helobdella robusta]
MIKSGFKRQVFANSVWTVPDYYNDLQYLGSGAFGQVCTARSHKLNCTVAIKKIKEPFLSPDHAKRVYREIKLLRYLNHENIISLVDLFSPNDSLTSFSEIYMVSILMDQDLRKLLDHYRLSIEQAKLVTYQILRALKYLHSGGIMHRDLKPSNIAVNNNFEIKILDFGLSRQINMKENLDLTPYVVARSYRAPEILFNWMHYKPNVDVWSTGCILAELLTNQVLFKSEDSIQHINCIFGLLGTPSKELLNKMTSEDAQTYIQQLPRTEKKDFKMVFPGADLQALDLLEKMFDLDPDTRILASECLAHPFLKQLSDPSDEPELQIYDSSFEDETKDLSTWKKLLYDEVTSA